MSGDGGIIGNAVGKAIGAFIKNLPNADPTDEQIQIRDAQPQTTAPGGPNQDNAAAGAVAEARGRPNRFE